MESGRCQQTAVVKTEPDVEDAPLSPVTEMQTGESDDLQMTSPVKLETDVAEELPLSGSVVPRQNGGQRLRSVQVKFEPGVANAAVADEPFTDEEMTDSHGCLNTSDSAAEGEGSQNELVHQVQQPVMSAASHNDGADSVAGVCWHCKTPSPLKKPKPAKQRASRGELPPAKMIQTDEEKKQERKVYEAVKRKRKWLESWRKTSSGEERSWLVYDAENHVMFCSVCREYATGEKQRRSTSFVLGCRTFKLEGITSHEKSHLHERCLRMMRTNKEPGKVSEDHVIKSLTEKHAGKMTVLFRTAHALAKMARPYSDFKWMCELDRQKGLLEGKTYTNRLKAKEFVNFIAKSERETLKEIVKNSKFVSLMSDGSAESAVVEEEIIYIRTANKGVPQVSFVGVAAVQKADADHVFDAVNKTVNSVLEGCDWQRKLVAFGTDGAASTNGVNHGMVAKFQHERGQHIIGIHCMMHRLELIFKDAVHKNVCHQKLNELLMGLYYFYRNSPLHRANLKRIFELKEIKSHLPSCVGGTHWVVNLRKALGHFLNGYAAIVQHLEQVQSPDAEIRPEQQARSRKFLKLATSSDVMQYACFLLDVLCELCSLLETLQTKHLSIVNVHSSMKAIRTLLEKYKERDGSMLQKLHKEAVFEKVKWTLDQSSFRSSRLRLLEGLLASTEKRFGDVETDILQATSVVDIASWPHKGDHKDFGDDHLDTLLNHFQPALAVAKVELCCVLMEWNFLKEKVYDLPDWESSLQSLDWQKVNKRWGQAHPNVLALVDLVLSLPASTAKWERGFHCMKMIKTDWRASLDGSSINDLMCVNLESPEISDFDPSKSIQLWLQSGVSGKKLEFGEKKQKTADRENLDLESDCSDAGEKEQEDEMEVVWWEN